MTLCVRSGNGVVHLQVSTLVLVDGRLAIEADKVPDGAFRSTAPQIPQPDGTITARGSDDIIIARLEADLLD